VCLQKEIPFLQIRGISNYVGERDKSKWKMEEAIDNLCNSLEDILKIV
ncbi:MAG: futalosine hydrolase, partial [Bacteroidetes bacterium]|nr:futalosine hydrolase [Bacteroidota bacterium]